MPSFTPTRYIAARLVWMGFIRIARAAAALIVLALGLI